jgi:hypothetical protein
MTAEAVVLAHGVGGRQDLPIPFSYALAGAASAVAVSFIVSALLWRTSRLSGDAAGRPVPISLESFADSAVTRAVLRMLGLVVTAFVAVTAVFGVNAPENPTAGFVYVLLWVGLVPASLLFGPVWKLLNPIRTLHLAMTSLTRTPPDQGLWRYPPWLGNWPAAAGLLAFVWLELVAPSRTTPSVIVIWFGAYAAVNIVGAVAFGSTWFSRADTFEVYSSLLGRLAPIGRRADRRLVLRNPLDGLDGTTPRPGLVAVVCVLLGSTAYDSFSNVPAWMDATQSGALPTTLIASVGLLAAILLVSAMFGTGIWFAGSIGGNAPEHLPRRFAHTIVPIAAGYLIAHYFSLFIFEGQRTLILASDPFSTGANLFGLTGRTVNFGIASPTTIAVVQVAAVVTGHVVGVIAAHDRAVRIFPPAKAIAGQIPLGILMIGYTVGGLALLFTA